MNNKKEKDGNETFSNQGGDVKGGQDSVSVKTNQRSDRKKSRVDSYLNQVRGIRNVQESVTVTFPLNSKKN